MENKTFDLSSQSLCEVPNLDALSLQTKKLNLDFNDISVLPSGFLQRISHLSCISLNGNNLETLPSDISLLKELSELYLKENSLCNLPESFCELKELKKLHLTGNQIVAFPQEFHQLISLSELIADENEIVQLPVNFGNLVCLTYLDLSNNSLCELPNSFGNLSNLRELDLSNNDLKGLPLSFSELPNLEILDLTNNEIKILPDKFLSAKSLKKILMNENSLTGLPQWLSTTENLEEMHFSANDLLSHSLPEDLGLNNANLVLVDLSGNNISSLFENFGKMKKLKFLDLGSSFDELERNRFVANGNKLKSLPDSFTNLQNLIKLELDENELLELPINFGQLENITYLDLCHNNLKLLPDSFCMLKNLKTCLFSMNYLVELPANFGMLTAVEELKLDNNLIVELPASFESMTNLTSLDLYNNSLKEIPNILSKLKKLKHLELRENNFGLPLEEIPDISFEPTYLKRKDELSENWRGKKRSDISSSAWVESKDGRPKTGFSGDDLNDDIIISALSSSSALWRKHGQTDSRQKSPKKVPSKKVACSISESSASNPSEILDDIFSESLINCKLNDPIPECEDDFSEINDVAIDDNDDNEYWDQNIYEEIKDGQQNCEISDCDGNWDSSSQKSCDSCCSTCSSPSTREEKFVELSDWESDFEDYIPNNFGKTYRHPGNEDEPNINVLVPSDMHASRIKKAKVKQPSVEGQFDDADL